MAKLKATPKTYEQAVAALGGRESVKLGNNTYLERASDNTAIFVRLYATDIVTFFLDGRITLRTGCYRTATTKDRINEFVAGRVYQRNHDWYYQDSYDAEGRPQRERTFTEGMNVGLVRDVRWCFSSRK